MGKKDILKIDEEFALDFDVLGYLDPNITVCIIKDGKLVEKKKLQLPQKIINVEKCKNPRCITSVEQGLDHVFYLANKINVFIVVFIVKQKLKKIEALLLFLCWSSSNGRATDS